MKPTFEWDAAKAESNVSKHGVSFSEAETVFDDAFAITFSDEQHSQDEARFIILGFSDSARILTVVYAERSDNIRIISSRRATKRERESYERYR